ncbi:MAG: hypothetical protein K6A33_04075 [Clostridiales bacterium]|nr:hypothetical protein [Clostridiales bacterium]
MKPTSIISLIVAVLLVIVGLVTCFIAQNMAQSNGEQLFADHVDGNISITEEISLDSLDIIKIVFSSGKVNIYGNCDTPGSDHYSEVSKLELVNFKENYYTLTRSGNLLSFDETGDITSMLKFWENGFSFKGMRYILNMEQIRELIDQKKNADKEERLKQINIYLTKEALEKATEDGDDSPPLKQIQITSRGAAGCEVRIDNMRTNTDYNITAEKVDLTVSQTRTDSFINVKADADSDAKHAKVHLENSVIGYLNIRADDLEFTSTSMHIRNELKLTSKTGSILFVSPVRLSNYNMEIRSKGRIQIDNTDMSSPYSYVAGSGNPTFTIESEEASVNCYEAAGSETNP